MIAALSAPGAYPHPVDRVELVETHISWVFLAGDYAYKFKKPLDLGFLDFRDRARRLHYCREELRLNGRLAPDIYLDVVGARETAEGWRVGPLEEDAEPAVRMRRFPAAARLDRRLAAGELEAAALETFALALAKFQRDLPPAPPEAGYGDAAAAARPALANFTALPADDLDAEVAGTLQRLEAWTRAQAVSLAGRFDARLAAGFVREGHGDLHLAQPGHAGRPHRGLRRHRVRPGAALDRRAERGRIPADGPRVARAAGSRLALLQRVAGGARGLRRAGPVELVPGVPPPGARQDRRHPPRAGRPRRGRVRAAAGAAGGAHRARRAPRTPAGAPAGADARPVGSGKSHLARRLAPLLPAAWVRSDLERKRLHGLEPLASAAANIGAGLYDDASSERTYARLAQIARTALDAGISLVVDAAFLEAERREEFATLALERGARPLVLACEAPAEVLRRRVAARRNDPSDAGLAVLEAQLARRLDTGSLEAGFRVPVDTSGELDVAALAARLLAR
jgi:uncharacterized protein